MKSMRVMVFGTFDVLHNGHLHFFKQARKLGSKCVLIVSVARDKNVKRVKGNYPSANERMRLRSVKESGLADIAVLGALTDSVRHILHHKPNIIALGYDQGMYVENLQKVLASRGLDVKVKRLKPYKPLVYKSSLLKQKAG